MIWTKAFWAGLGERAIKTAAQSLAASFVVGVTLLNLDWEQALALAGTTTLASILTSIANADFTAGPPAAIVVPAPVVAGE